MGRGIDRSQYFPQLHTTLLGQIKCRDVIVWTVTEPFSKIRRLSMGLPHRIDAHRHVVPPFSAKELPTHAGDP
jgi:hypothetical protein